MKDVEFHVEARYGGHPTIFSSFDKAAGFALVHAASHGDPVNIDVVIWSEAGARSWGGGDAVEQYREDPEASVFERIEIRAGSHGRVR